MTPPARQSGYAPVNGVELYYEMHGPEVGPPLVLLHGGIIGSATFAPLLPAFAATRRVITVDLQGHGQTRDIDRPLLSELMADDVAGLLAQLGIARADVLGYSMGGGVALQTAIRHPQVVNALVVISMAFRREGSYPEVLAHFDQMTGDAQRLGGQLQDSPLADQFPDVNWVTLFANMGDMVTQAYDWSADVAAITAPTLLIFADADSIRPEHMVEFFGLLGGGQRDAGLDGSLRPVSRLAILPGTTHYDILAFPGLAEIVAAFLAAPHPRAA